MRNKPKIVILRGISPKQITQLNIILEDAISHGAALDVDTNIQNAFYNDAAFGLKNGDGIMAVALLDGNIVGSVLADFCKQSYMQHIAQVSKLIVVPKHRKQGIGRLLMLSIEKAIRQKGRTKIELSFRKGNMVKQFYERLGYRQWGIATNATKHGDKYFKEIFMERIFR
ncbi:MAG: GNAT family N-acetyltransferase [Planctomycetes bacterium]|nr:GNAT family N-acetyltransferase [Planctomycetota bacterium]